MEVKIVPSEWFEFSNRNDVLDRESPEFMQISDLETFFVHSICTLSLISQPKVGRDLRVTSEAEAYTLRQNLRQFLSNNCSNALEY